MKKNIFHFFGPKASGEWYQQKALSIRKERKFLAIERIDFLIKVLQGIRMESTIQQYIRQQIKKGGTNSGSDNNEFFIKITPTYWCKHKFINK